MNYTTQKNLQILISLLKQYDVRDIVISPGSRNMAFVRSVESDPFFTTYSVVDERSAAYFAIGVSLETGRPVALSCTSAQATRNYIPGMTEAYYRQSKLVFITGDYRPSIIGQGVMQAMEQMSIPKDAARYSVQLPLIHDAADIRHCTRVVNEALLELDHHGSGPVHIDVATEEHWTGGVDKLPVAAKINRHTSRATYPDLSGKKILVVIGQHVPFTDAEQRALDTFSEKYNTVVYANLLSNYEGPRSLRANLMLEGMDAKIYKEFAPDIFITIGGQPGDYALDSKLKIGGKHWRVNQDGRLQDTYSRLTDVFETSAQEFFEAYAESAYAESADDSYYRQWKTQVDARVVPSELPLSHAYIAHKLLPEIPNDSLMHFAILSSLRNWSYFEPTSSFASYANVAAFGIDGCLSTFIGNSVATDRLSFLMIGDLSFFYDMNALGIRHIKNNARILLVNNSGGGEFRLYQHAASEFGKDANKHIAAGGHNGSARGWVESMGWVYLPVHTKDELADSVDTFVGDSDKPVFMEVFTTMEDDSDGVKLLVGANSSKTLQRKIFDTLSPNAKRTIKKIIKK